MHLSERWESAAVSDRLLRAALAPASWAYSLGWQAYLGIYRLGAKGAKRPHSPVICIGNLVTGGTGKSPITLYIARMLKEMGRPVAVSVSGYGSPASTAAQVAPTGILEANEWGDEAAMLRMEEPDLPLIVGRRRILAAELCEKHFPDAVLLLDDGFQHLPLHKDVSIVLDPPRRNHFCLPAGPYREPWRNRRRADLVLPNGFRIASDPLTFSVGGDSNQSELPNAQRPTPSGFGVESEPLTFSAGGDSNQAELPNAQRPTPSGFGVESEPLTFSVGGDSNQAELPNAQRPTPNAQRVSVLCALGQPQGFVRAVEETGLEIVARRLLPDHDSLLAGNLLDGLPSEYPIVVTTKDWVKLRTRPDIAERCVWIARHRVRVEPEGEFRRWIAARLDGCKSQTL